MSRSAVPPPGAVAGPPSAGTDWPQPTLQGMRLVLAASNAAMEELRVTEQLNRMALAAVEEGDLDRMLAVREILMSRLGDPAAEPRPSSPLLRRPPAIRT